LLPLDNQYIDKEKLTTFKSYLKHRHDQSINATVNSTINLKRVISEHTPMKEYQRTNDDIFSNDFGKKFEIPKLKSKSNIYNLKSKQFKDVSLFYDF
jgi:hypothetical protein